MYACSFVTHCNCTATHCDDSVAICNYSATQCNNSATHCNNSAAHCNNNQQDSQDVVSWVYALVATHCNSLQLKQVGPFATLCNDSATHCNCNHQDVRDVVRWMHALFEKGSFRSWGTSNWTPDRRNALVLAASEFALTPPTADSPQRRCAMTNVYMWHDAFVHVT